MATALYPGGFKPPHRGHFEVVERLLNGTHNGKVYTFDDYKTAGPDVLSGKKDKIEKIDKVVVFIGAGERNGISAEESKAVWEIYKKYLGNIEIYYKVPNPMGNASAYAKDRPNEKFYAVTGIRTEDDTQDLRRITTFKNRDNVTGLVIAGPSEQRATNFRQAILSGNLDKVKDFFPSQLTNDEILKIINMLKKSIISEVMSEKVDELFDSWFGDDTVNEFYSTPANKAIPPTKSADRQKLVYLYDYLKNIIPSDSDIEFKHDHIVVKRDNEKSSNFNYTPYMASILEYMLDKGMNILPLPEIKIRRDVKEASNFFGRTAYYDPNVNEVVLYVEGRHPKDIMRSFVHEMIHHIQNIEDRMGSVGTSNTNESEELLKLEQEAYLTGNITFRNWEDSIKNANEGLWANINAKKKAGRKSSHGNSKAYKAAVKAGDKLEKNK